MKNNLLGVSCLLFACVVFSGAQDSDLGENDTSIIALNTCSGLEMDNATVLLDVVTIPYNIMAENVNTNFSIQIKPVNCTSGKPGIVKLSKSAGTPNKILKNGYLKVQNEYYPPAEYCINEINEDDYVVKVCPLVCGGTRPCIKKCCGLHKVYNFERKESDRCTLQKEDYWKPKFYDDFDTSSIQEAILDPYFIHHPPSQFKLKCPDNKSLEFLHRTHPDNLNSSIRTKFNSLIYRIRKDGVVMFKLSGSGSKNPGGVLDTDDYCVDGATKYRSANDTATLTYSQEDIALVLCAKTFPENSSAFSSKRIAFATRIFILITAAVTCIAIRSNP